MSVRSGRSAIALFAVLAATTAACSSSPGDATETSGQAVVLGDDERAPITDARLSDAIGTLRGGVGECTAFAVDEDRVLTAHHCIGRGRGLTVESGRGVVAHVLEVVRARPEIDVAELRVDRRFNAPLARASALPDDSVRVVGWDPTSRRILASAPCRLGEEIAEGSALLPHLCDTMPGASGGPVLRGDAVVAMHLGFTAGANVALDLDALDDPNASVTRAAATVQNETTCTTNCSSSCEVSYNYPCPTWKKPGRTCRGHTLDPACKARCEVERELDCRTGLNGCDLWRTNPIWVQARETLRAAASQGVTAEQCVSMVNLGKAAGGAASFAYDVYISGLQAAVSAAANAFPVAFVVGEVAKHGAACACREALP